MVEIEETGDLEKVPLADLERVDDLAGLFKSRRFDSPARFDLRTAATFLETEQRRTGVPCLFSYTGTGAAPRKNGV